MLDDALADFERQVQAGKASVALLEYLDDAQRVEIVIEAVAKLPHLPVQLFLAGVREGRMANVVAQGQRFGEVLSGREVVEGLGQTGVADRHALQHLEGHRAVIQAYDDDRHACRRSLALSI